MSKPKRTIGYARVSSEEQARGSSLQDQQNAITAYAASRGLTVTKFYVEAASGIRKKVEHREQMAALMADVKRGDLVLCDKLDRWSRDAEFSYKSTREILACGAHFYAVSDQCDPSTSEGDTAMSFRILFAREEHKRIKERMVGTRRNLRDRGLYVEGLPPYGYRRTLPKGERGPTKNVLVVDEERGAKVRRAFQLSIAGFSLARIASDLGLKRDRIISILSTRTYVGQLQDTRGRWINGTHEALVDADTFCRSLAAYRKRRLGDVTRETVPETAAWILRDVASCAKCGAWMGAAYGRKDAKERRYYYRCIKKLCGASYVGVRVVEDLVALMVVARLTDIRNELADEPERAIKKPLDMTTRKAALAKKRDAFVEMFADSEITREKFRVSIAKVDAEMLRLEAEEQASRKSPSLETPALRREVLREVKMLERAWRDASQAQRREIANLIIVRVRLEAGVVPVVEWRTNEDLADHVRA